MTGKEEYPDRKPILSSKYHTYFHPLPLIREELDVPEQISFHNVLTGLQWYQAHNNEAFGRLSDTERIKLLLEIFENHNDLLSLARTVELQTGVNGLIKSVMESYGWAEWKIIPKLGNVTEVVHSNPHISLDVVVGSNSLRAVSTRFLEWSNEKNDLVSLPSEFRIFEGSEELDDFEHGALPQFNLRFVEVLSGNRIRLEGTEDWGDDDELDDPKRLYFSYILTSTGKLEYDERHKIDRKIAIKQIVMTAVGPMSILPDPEETNWIKVRDSFEDPLVRKALASFLLPYCDMPTTVGPYYMLPEESS